MSLLFVGLGFDFAFASVGSLGAALNSGRSGLFQVLPAPGLGPRPRRVRVWSHFFCIRGPKTSPSLCMVVNKTLPYFWVRTFQKLLASLSNFYLNHRVSDWDVWEVFSFSVRWEWVSFLSCYLSSFPLSPVTCKEVSRMAISKGSTPKWKCGSRIVVGWNA